MMNRCKQYWFPPMILGGTISMMKNIEDIVLHHANNKSSPTLGPPATTQFDMDHSGQLQDFHSNIFAIVGATASSRINVASISWGVIDLGNSVIIRCNNWNHTCGNVKKKRLDRICLCDGSGKQLCKCLQWVTEEGVVITGLWWKIPSLPDDLPSR